MKGKQQIKIIKRGYVDIDSLTVEQQKMFYATLLARILEAFDGINRRLLYISNQTLCK